MNLQTNQLWVVQEIIAIDVQFHSRKRRGKLFLVYDYRSSFVLCAQFYFTNRLINGKKQLFRVLQNFGIPDCIMMTGMELKNQLAEELEFHLGIDTVLREYDLYQDKNEEFVKEWNHALEYIKDKQYADVRELYGEIQSLVYIWNRQEGIEQLGIGPIQRYREGRQEHVFLEKQTLLECCLRKVKQIVSDRGWVQVFHRFYKVPEKYIGKTLTFWVSLVERKEIYIYDDDRSQLLYRCPLVKE